MASEVHKVAGSRHFEGPDYLMYVRDPDKAPITQFVAGASLFARHSQTNNARQRHMDLRVENSTFIGGAAWFCLDPIIQPRPNRSWSVPAVINLKMGVEFGHHQERYYFPGPAVPEKSSGIWGGLYFSGNF